jgi:hypothetical protein
MKKSLIIILSILLLVSFASAGPTGHAYTNVRCMHNIFSYEMTLVTFTYNEAMPVYVSPDGYWDSELLVGKYALILLDGDTGHREYRYFEVRADEITHIDPFIGHAISPKGNTTPEPIPTPTVTPIVTPTVSPTISPTPIPTTIPTIVPTVSPTPIPTITPTPTPAPQCERVWVCGDWEWFCWGDWCIPNPGHCFWVEKCI